MTVNEDGALILFASLEKESLLHACVQQRRGCQLREGSSPISCMAQAGNLFL